MSGIGRPRVVPRLGGGFHFYEDRWWYHYVSRSGNEKRFSAKRSVCGFCETVFSHRTAFPGRFCSTACYHSQLRVRHYGIGDTRQNSDGYLLEKVASDDPLVSMSRPGQWVLQHRLVKARELKRALGEVETVHHKNGNRSDNREENLELRVGGHGPGASAPHCSTCTCFLHSERNM